MIGDSGEVGRRITNAYHPLPASDLSLAAGLSPLPATTSGHGDITHSGRDHVLCGAIMTYMMWPRQALV